MDYLFTCCADPISFLLASPTAREDILKNMAMNHQRNDDAMHARAQALADGLTETFTEISELNTKISEKKLVCEF